VISQIWEATAAKRMNIDPCCQWQNCRPIKVLFMYVLITLILLGIRLLRSTVRMQWAKMAILNLFM